MSDKHRIIEYAEGAKSFIANSDEEPLPDEMLVRAAIAFDQLQRAGKDEPDHYLKSLANLDAFERSFVIAMIAANFADNPPSTPQRAKLLSTKLVDECGYDAAAEGAG